MTDEPPINIFARAAARKRRGPGNTRPPGQEWKANLATSETGKIVRSLSNALVAFREAPEWRGVFAWNAFASRLVITREMPARRNGMAVPRDLSETDVTHATDWLQRNGILVGSAVTREAVRAVAEDATFHPVRDWLDGLEWDGVARLDAWLTGYLGVAPIPLHCAFAARWIIGLVARVMRPGCQFDTMLILEGPQGLRKSTALRVIADPWFTDHLPDLTNKDALAQIQGVLVTEIAELSTLGRAETSRIKSFISTRVDRFRPPYGSVPVDHPRQCGFAGTINPGGNGYMRDETGARRFWIVACAHGWHTNQQIDVEALAAVKDQLWAEAVVRYRAGENWWLDTEPLETAQRDAAEKRRTDDPRERRIREYITGLAWVRLDQILGGECLNIPVERWTVAMRMEIGAVMVTLKWQRRLKRVGPKEREWRYYPEGSTDDEDKP